MKRGGLPLFDVPGLFVFGHAWITRLRFLLHSPSKTEERNEGRGGHHPRHDQQHRPGGVSEIQSNELGDRTGNAAGLGLGDTARLCGGLSGG